jgi:hypothetical protein
MYKCEHWYTPFIYGIPGDSPVTLISDVREAVVTIIIEDITYTQKLSYLEKARKEDIRPVFLTNIANDGFCLIEVDVLEIESERIFEGTREILVYPSAQSRELAEKLANKIWDLLKRQYDVLARVKFHSENRQSGGSPQYPATIETQKYQIAEVFIEKE